MKAKDYKKVAFVALLALLSVFIPAEALPKYGKVNFYFDSPAMVNEVGIRTVTYGWFNCHDYGIKTPYYFTGASDDCQ